MAKGFRQLLATASKSAQVRNEGGIKSAHYSLIEGDLRQLVMLWPRVADDPGPEQTLHFPAGTTVRKWGANGRGLERQLPNTQRT